MFAKANGKKVYDTPSFSIDDMTAFEDEVKQSVALGFDGKLAISPKHVACINSEFGAYDIDNMRQIVRQYESAGQAVAVIGGKVYEKMHIARMKRIITENGGI